MEKDGSLRAHSDTDNYGNTWATWDKPKPAHSHDTQMAQGIGSMSSPNPRRAAGRARKHNNQNENPHRPGWDTQGPRAARCESPSHHSQAGRDSPSQHSHTGWEPPSEHSQEGWDSRGGNSHAAKSSPCLHDRAERNRQSSMRSAGQARDIQQGSREGEGHPGIAGRSSGDSMG